MPATEMKIAEPEPMSPSVNEESAPENKPAPTAEFKPVGKIPVDTKTPYIEHNQADFGAARSTGKILKTDGSVSWKSLKTNWNDELFRSEIQKSKGG